MEYIYFRCVYCNGNGNRPDFGSGCNAYFVQIYRNAMEQSAVTSSSQSCEQVQNTVENYTQDMRIILEGIVARMRHENNHSEEYIQNLVNIRSDVVAVTICGEDGELLRYWNRGQKLKENYRIVQSTEMEDDDGRLRITKPYVESLFEDIIHGL